MKVTFKGLDISLDNNYLIVEIDGWEDLPSVTNGSTPKPTRIGSQLGGLTSPRRVVTLTLDILGDPENGFETTLPKRKLRNVMTLHDEESPLLVELGFGIDPEIAFVRVTGLEMPTTRGYGHTQRVVIEFTANDPRRYSPIEYTARTGLPTPVRGTLYPIAYGDYPAVLIPEHRGEAVLQNLGNFEAPAIYQLTGPARTPSVTVINGKHIHRTYFDVDLVANEVLVADTAKGTVTIDGSARNGITTGALVEDLGLPPGQCTVKLDGSGNTSTSLVINWRDANL